MNFLSKHQRYLGKSVLGLVMGLALTANAQTTAFFFTGPNGYVCGGKTGLVTAEDGFVFYAQRNFDNGVSLDVFGPNPLNFGASLNFAAPHNVPLTIGTYLDATRYPFQAPNSPGLSFSMNGRGDNTLTGFFTVLEIAYGPGNSITSFAADFTQYDEGQMNWWNQGSIRFNSSLPIPEPAVPSLLITGCAILLRKLCQGKTQQSASQGKREPKPTAPAASALVVASRADS